MESNTATLTPPQASTSNPASWDATSLCGEYLTFHLGNEEFAFEILKVRELIELMDMTSVPGAPSFIRGVINLRGKIIPVMKLRERFGLPEVEDNERNCIIVVEVVNDDGESASMGILVDAVSEVMNIGVDDIAPPPDFGGNVNTSFILGMARAGEEVKTLLNIEQIVLEAGTLLDASAALATNEEE
ncbi:MAG: chemotaxis protein CheW [Planctomycetaceae bacterium]|nr:chemotaxis protein CheW [Planctomycetaceae bacterium]